MEGPLLLRSAVIGIVLVLPLVNVRVRRMLATWVARWKLSLLAPSRHDKAAAPTVAGVFIYPVKSLRAVSLVSGKIDDRGIVGDRRFMIVCPNPPPLQGGPVDATHRFVTQRQCPVLATIDAKLSGDSLILSNGDSSVTIATNKLDRTTFRARIWDNVVTVMDAGDEAADFLQSIVTDQKGVRLVAIAETDSRVADDAYVPPEGRTWTGSVPRVALSDGFPILIACTASLEEVNRRLRSKGKEPIPMARFRPNIVVNTTRPFEEDSWKTIQVGDTILHLVKGCPRCKQSCTDQVTGKVSQEPLETLADFRALGPSKENVYFAQNALSHSIGTDVSVGDSVKVLKRGEPVWDKGSVQAE